MIGRFILLATLLASRVLAQEPKTGIVQVTVEEAMGMVSGLSVRAAGQRASTDSLGVARLRLPPGRQVVSITGIGYKPVRIAVEVVADAVIAVRVPMTMAEMVMQEVKVSATRIERLAGETPTRVEVLDEMEVDENTLMAPSGITMLLNETPGLRVFSASPTVGSGSVRILGLPGQYTVMLADGLPLFGGATSALGPLDVSPVDLQRVEIIKGAASSLYGGQALGGVINLISKQPTGKNELLVNRRTMGVTDGATWLSHRFNDVSGISFLASGSRQDGFDIDGDGWLDQPGGNRWGLRPRFTMADSSGRSVFLTVGHAEDSRIGGTARGAVTPGGTPISEGLNSRRDDIGARAVIPAGDSGNFALRFALSRNIRGRHFDEPELLHETEISRTGFVEVTRSFVGSSGGAVLGSSVQRDGFNNTISNGIPGEERTNPAYNHGWVTPSLFAAGERDVGPLTLSLSARSDFHPAAGTQLTERVAILAKPVEGWSVRLGGGTGFAPPTASNEETEAIGLHAIRPGPELKTEKSYGTMLDINGQLAGAEVLVTTYASFIDGAIRVADAGDGSGEGILRNTNGITKVGGVEGAAIWRFEGGKFLGTYGYARGRRPPAGPTGTEEDMPMLPRHRAGGDLMFEKEGKYRGGIEGIWYGKQQLDNNPYRTESKPYLYLMAIYMRQLGRLEAVANFENLLNVRQTDTDPLVRPTQTTGGRWTTDVWAPLEGFMANVALRYRW